MSKSLSDSNLEKRFESLKPQQRLVNILFDEVKLKQAMRFTGGHVVGHAENNGNVLATSALVTEIVCHYGGPRKIMRIIPVSCLKAPQLKDVLLQTAQGVLEKGGKPISFISDNCPLNQATYNALGGPGYVHLPTLGISADLVYDYIHIFTNLRNSWIAELSKELSFSVDEKEYVAKWSDVEQLYEEDKKNPIRLTKLSYTSVYPKLLQRQSVPFVS